MQEFCILSFTGNKTNNTRFLKKVDLTEDNNDIIPIFEMYFNGKILLDKTLIQKATEKERQRNT